MKLGSIRNLFWFFFCILILAVISSLTGITSLYDMNLSFFIISCLFFLVSVFFWIQAWNYLMKEDFFKSLKINTKALMGIFAPFGIGGDLLRAYFAKQEGIEGARALSASFMVKFFKFLLMFFYLLIAIYLLASLSVDFPQYITVFISALLLTMFGAVVVLLFRIKKFVNFIFKALNKVFILKFYDRLTEQFFDISLKRSFVVVILLMMSTVFELLAINYAFLAVNHPLLITHIFILGAVIHSLALITITPQGIGFVDAGGFLILSMGYFAVSKPVIGGFLIVWNLIRIWIPSLIGLAVSTLDTKR